MTKFDTLYKRTRTGEIQFWCIEATSTEENNWITKRSGRYGTTNPIIHNEKILEGKQKRTAWEQALFMAESDWKKKRDEGYKTLEDLGIEAAKNAISGDFLGYTVDSLGMGFKPDELCEALDRILPQFNTDANGEVKPMLAPNKGWEANGKTKYPVQGEIKSDGLRSFIVLTPEDTVILSRSGKPYSKMTHLVAIIDQAFPKEIRTKKFILDGELYLHGLSLQKMNQAIKGENEYQSKIEFWIYDLPLSPHHQAYRSAQITLIIDKINNPLFRHNAPVILKSDEEVIAYHDEMVNLGYEGVMVKDLNGTYQPGQRSPFWKKVKRFEDHEFEVAGYRFGQRGVQDLNFI
jgi:hypothetical protein